MIAILVTALQFWVVLPFVVLPQAVAQSDVDAEIGRDTARAMVDGEAELALDDEPDGGEL